MCKSVVMNLIITNTGTVLGWNTCYVVCGLVVKDEKILMVQEAKPSCRGLWYMPAGRVEKNESLEVHIMCTFHTSVCILY